MEVDRRAGPTRTATIGTTLPRVFPHVLFSINASKTVAIIISCNENNLKGTLSTCRRPRFSQTRHQIQLDNSHADTAAIVSGYPYATWYPEFSQAQLCQNRIRNLGCQEKSKKKPQPSLPLLLRERQIQARMRIRRAKLAAAMKPVLSRRQNLLQHRVNVFIGVERGAGGSSVKVGERDEGRTLSYVQVASIC